MTRQKKQKGPATTYDKLAKVDPHFLEEVTEGTSTLALKDRIVNLSRNAAEIAEAKENDLDLAEKSEALKEANASYTEPLKAIKLKTKYLHEMLKSRGDLIKNASSLEKLTEQGVEVTAEYGNIGT